MFHMISNLDPYNMLCRDLYSADIFCETTNGQLSVVEKDDKNQIVIIKKNVEAGNGEQHKKFLFIKCLNFLCETDDVEKFLSQLDEAAKNKIENNDKVEPILVAPGFCGRALESVEGLNRFTTNPIILYKYGS